MEARRTSYLDKPTYVYLHGGDFDRRNNTNFTSLTPSDAQFEFDESDLWDDDIDSSENPFPVESKNPIPTSRKAARKSVGPAEVDRRPPIGPSASLPVNVPDWSKVVRNERRRTVEDGGDEGGDEDEDGRIPPHEYLARTRRASFSVHEGNGRTLKGRDLSRVRNAIWKQTGFED